MNKKHCAIEGTFSSGKSSLIKELQNDWTMNNRYEFIEDEARNYIQETGITVDNMKKEDKKQMQHYLIDWEQKMMSYANINNKRLFFDSHLASIISYSEDVFDHDNAMEQGLIEYVKFKIAVLQKQSMQVLFLPNYRKEVEDDSLRHKRVDYQTIINDRIKRTLDDVNVDYITIPNDRIIAQTKFILSKLI